MSHILEISATQMEKEGFLVIKDAGNIKALEIMRRTCKALNRPMPSYEASMTVAGVKAPGYSISLEGWTGPVSVNTETGRLAFDNYSPYGPDHPEVLAGKRRVGENGRWGDLSELDKFRKEYENQLNQHLAETQQEVAARNGHYVNIVEQTPERIVLEIEA